MNRRDSLMIIDLMKRLIEILEEKNRKNPHEVPAEKIQELKDWVKDREEEVEEHGGIR